MPTCYEEANYLADAHYDSQQDGKKGWLPPAYMVQARIEPRHPPTLRFARPPLIEVRKLKEVSSGYTLADPGGRSQLT